ncbi:beta-ketoacyl synthase chain length factor [Metallibacterium scheffleri]|uniref:beta-ketoacyl synthase chain length factor n=1 Tax=Metallibacterium scheffleri TaxID=993689 RepID=UPI0023F3644F|nr:beta-ketoacyl synthase chain length factor [Metallibacterium scheffleri]
MNTALHATIIGWGLCAPGLDDAAAFADWLRDPARALPVGRHANAMAARMTPTEHRRAPHAVRLALEAATQAVGARDASAIGAVFCSAFGDMANTDAILGTLAQAPDQVSPTRFTHSVHNAAAGHWSMAAASHAPMSALACGREGIGPALLAALLDMQASAAPQLVVLFDTAAAGALADVAPCSLDFAAALLLAPLVDGQPGPRLLAQVEDGQASAHAPRDARLQPWYAGNPAARALPLLEICLGAAARRFTWPLGSGTLLTLHCEYRP